MNYNALSSPTMLSNSSGWLNNKRVRASLEAHPLGMAILGEMAAAHDDLNSALSQRGQLEVVLAKLTERLQVMDDIFDSGARGLYGFLGSFAEVAETPEEAEGFLQARTLLFPNDLDIVRRSFADEHGAVLAAEERITEEVRQLLMRTQVGTRTLYDIYERWVDAGKQLGEMAQERARLRATIQRSGDLGDSTLDTRNARNNWIRVARIFLGVVDLLPLSEEDRRAILAPLQRDIDNAQRARARGAQGSASGDAPAGDGEPGDDVASDAPAGE